MRTQNRAMCILVVALAAVSLAQAQGVNQARSGMRRAETPASRVSSESARAAAVPSVALPRAPDVVGLSLNEAYGVLSRAGLAGKTTYLETTDDAVLYDHVSAAIPAAGQVVGDGLITLQVPRPAAQTFAGALSLVDVVRRDGFDLDQGRYEQILRGADMVLREDKTSIPHADPNGGSTYYTTKGLFVEPSDGAVFAVPGLSGVSADGYPGGLASAPNYSACKRAMEGPRADYLNLPRADAYGQDLFFCAFTSERQIAVVHFRQRDMACCGKDNYKFHVAIFPREMRREPRSREALLNAPRVGQ